MRLVPTVLALGLASAGCSGDPGDPGDEPSGASPITLSFRAEELPTGAEDYLCYGFDATELAGRALERIAWSPPEGGGVTLHHATAYAMQEPFPDGPLSCEWMPASAIGLHLWGPGGDPLVLPDGFALAIPEGTTKIVIQAHVLRLSDDPAAPASVVLSPAASAPEHLAAWHSTFTDVPPIPPHGGATASSRCRARADVHALFVWPHMHRLGKEFRGSVERANGEVVPLVDVPAWDVARERTYPVAVDIGEGDEIVTSCTWENGGDDFVYGGPLSTDEMCTQGIVSWPADAPRCDPS
jgi:hypothetical protein